MSGVKLFHVTLSNEKTINCPFYMFSGDGAYLFDNKVNKNLSLLYS